MNRTFLTHNHGARIDTTMHRATLIDDSCAEEGGVLPSAHGPVRCKAPKKQTRDEVAIGWHMALQGIGGVLLLIALGAGLAMLFHSPQPGDPVRVVKGQR